ncbi:putative ribonuclease H-like domain-containing protein [Tanacetum coccineum]
MNTLRRNNADVVSHSPGLIDVTIWAVDFLAAIACAIESSESEFLSKIYSSGINTFGKKVKRRILEENKESTTTHDKPKQQLQKVVYHEIKKLPTHYSATLQNKLPPKETDPGSFIILCIIGNHSMSNALADLGVSISIIPYSLFKRLELGSLKPIKMTIEMADRSMQSPKGIKENVLVKISNFVFPADFIILGIMEDENIPIILGRPMFATAHAKIDVYGKKISLGVRNDQVVFNINKKESPASISPICVINRLDKTQELDDLVMIDETARDFENYLSPEYESQDIISLSPSKLAKVKEDFSITLCDPDKRMSIVLEEFAEIDDVWDDLDLGIMSNEKSKTEFLKRGGRIHLHSPGNLQLSYKIGFVNFTGSNSANTDSTSDAIDADDLEEMDLKWQMAMLTMRARRFLNKTGRKINANGSETIGALRENRNREPVRRNVTVETTETKALVAQDGLGYDWSDQAEEGPTNFALMAYTSSGSSSSSSSDSESQLNVGAYKAGLESVEARLDVYKKNELRKKFEKAEKERDDLKLTLEKFRNSSKNLSKLLEIQVSDKFKTGVGFDSQVVDSQVFDSQENDRYKTRAKTSVSKPKSVGEPLIEDWISDSEDENETEFKSKQRKPSFAKIEFVYINEHRENTLGVLIKKFKNKACYECGSFNHLIKDCDLYEKKMVEKTIWNNARRINHQNSQRLTHPHPKGNFVPKAVLMKSGIKTLNNTGQNFSKAAVSVNTARPINTAYPRPTVNSARTASNIFNRAHIHVRRPFNKSTSNKNSNLKEKVNTVKGNVTTTRPKAVGNPQLELQEKGVIDSGCSRHMTGNKSYLSDYEEIDGGFIALEEIPKEVESLVKVKSVQIVTMGTKFKKKVMESFYEMKGIKREFSVARTPQQNGVAERKNRTLIEAARTMLADSKLPTTFWAKAVNTACYVQNRVLVIKPHNKTPYELFLGRKPALSFIRPFGCPVTIFNTLDHLGKFDGKADEGFFVGYSTNSKAYRVFNSRTRIVEENLHVKFSEETPNIAGNGPNWLFDIDALTISMNYKPVVTGNQTNGNASTKENIDAGQDGKKIVPDQEYNTAYHKVWTLVDLPYGKRAIRTKWVYRNKKDDRGIMVRNKERLVAQGYTQEEGSKYTPKIQHLHVVKRIFRYSKGYPKLGLWYPRDSPFDLETFSNSDYTVASLDMKSITRAEYVAAANSCGQKPEESNGFEGIIDFLNASSINYALTVNPIVYESCIQQFWAIAKAKTVNGECQIQTLVDKKKVIITEKSVRSDLMLEDAEGTECLLNDVIFEQLTLIGMNFSSTMQSASSAGNRPNWLFDINALTISMNYKLVVAGNQTNGNAGTKENIDACQDGKKIDSPNVGFKPSGEEEKIDYEHPENKDSEVPNTEEPRVHQEQYANVNSTNNINTVCPTVNPTDIENNAVDENIVYGCIDDPSMPNLEKIVYSDDDEEVSAEANMNNLATTMLVSPIPTTRVHKDHPLEQIIRDIHSPPQSRRMTKNVTEHVEPKKKVWTLVDLPYGKRAIGTKWVYKNKKDDKGIVVINKERMVAQGYTQEEGIDYDEVFALVARIEAIRLFLAYASFMNFIVYQMDVKSAFLYGTIEEEVYVCQPLGFEDLEFPNKIYKVEKALYDLHQAPRAWYETLSTYLLENGFRRGTIDKTLFTKKDKDDIMLVQVYVDDIIFGSTKKSLCTEFEQIMHKRFQMSSMGELTFFLGFTPMETNKALLKDEEAADVNVHLYRSMIGSLMYLTASRPDIMFAVCAFARDLPFDLEAFSDSDYAGASLDRKSTTGGCQFLGRRLISWQCKKQTIVANSTTEA